MNLVETDGNPHTGFCIKSTKRKVPQVDIPITTEFDFGTAIENVYPLLEMVFDYLDYKDLRNASQVNKTWKDFADKILEKRAEVSWFSCYKTKQSNVLHHSDNLNMNNIGIGIILYNSRKVKLQEYICIHTDKLMKKTVVEYLADEFVPTNIDYCLISCPKVKSYFPKCPKVDTRSSSTFDGVVLPKIPNINTAMFHCNPVKVKELHKSISNFIKETEEVKCLLMFCKTDLSKSIYSLLKMLLPGEHPQEVAVGGGIIRGTKTFQKINTQKKVFSSNDVFCITFSQEKGIKSEFNAYSTVITGDDLSNSEFEEELVKFKTAIALRTNSVAIRVCCSAKVQTEDELILFGKVFPNIPLLGMDADGEIGWSNHNSLDTEDFQPKRMKNSYPIVQHQWSTVLVLITWGKFLNE